LEYRFNKTPLEGSLSDFTEPVELVKVDETRWESFWDKVVREHHYLGHESVIGSRIKYLIALGNRVVGAISFCSGAYKLGPRDKFVGWDEPTRVAMLPHLVRNNRFLIFPWVKVRNLASHVLSLSLKRLKADWARRYEVEPCMVETFVDVERFSGACCAAANWSRLGETKGFGRQGNGFLFHGHAKDIFVKVLSRRFASGFHPDVDRLRGEKMELLSTLNGIPFHRPGIMDELGLSDFDSQTMLNLLCDHLEPYMPYPPRKEAKQHMVAMVKGLLSDLDRKSIWPICGNFAGSGEYRNMANFMTRSPWNNDGILDEYQKEAGRLLSHPKGMITGDGCDFPKKGGDSCGVARQHCGPLGKTDNCQASVMVGYASEVGCGLVDYELCMPEKWFGDYFEGRREKCRVPKGVEFRTKNAILSGMINELRLSGRFQGKHVGVDSAFGDDHVFLDSMPPELVYFADVHGNLRVFPDRPDMVLPEYRGRGRKPKAMVPSVQAVSVKELVADESRPWSDVALGMGAKGPIIAKDKCVKVVEVRDGGPGRDVWLYARRLEDGQIKYSLCNESMDATLEDIRTPALMRWSIEQCFNECKGSLGMDQYEVRTWQGWRRHILLTFIAHAFITKLRLRFGAAPSIPGSAPIVEKPVDARDYAEAAVCILT
jgi:SRSO17 transposase